MRGSELDIFSLFSGLIGMALFFLMVLVVVPLISAGIVAVIHLRLRADRELLEGTHTVAAYGSRAGARIGMYAGMLLSGGWTLLAVFMMAGDRSFSFLSTIFCLAAVLPAAAWGMLAGSIAGNRSNERTAGIVGAVMFTLLANPLGGLSLLIQLAQHPEYFFDHVFSLLGDLAGLLLYVVAGALTGVLAVRTGRERLAEGVRPAPLPFFSPRIDTDNRKGMSGAY